MRRKRGDYEGAERLRQFTEWGNVIGQRSLTALGYNLYHINSDGKLRTIWIKWNEIIERIQKVIGNQSGLERELRLLMKDLQEVLSDMGHVGYRMKGGAIHKFVIEALKEFSDEYFFSDVYFASRKIIQSRYFTNDRFDYEL
eukprot:TRINITY_DN9018_c0_g1_i2.p2 TRINITY_DN9018_c0_g1~~TRINITY_DN9018_c0_g1_i2.p2  ORF type:complete len:142 (-),score=13.65 TRINITY_DN9018_c0_g1_i2:244-669(-)